jgi:hypothetical protein
VDGRDHHRHRKLGHHERDHVRGDLVADAAPAAAAGVPAVPAVPVVSIPRPSGGCTMKAEARTVFVTVGLIMFGGFVGFLVTLLTLGRH